MPPAPPPPSERKKAEVNAGTLVGVFGVRGELKLDASRIGTDAMRPGLAATLRWPDGHTQSVTIAGVRMHQGRPLIRIAGADSADAAAPFVRAQVSIARDDAPLDAGEFFDDDLIGCTLRDPAGVERGRVVDVLHYPAQDILVVEPGRALLPLVRAFVRGVDVGRKEISVDVPPGLLDPAAAEEA